MPSKDEKCKSTLGFQHFILRMNKKWSRQLRGGESADSLVLLARCDRFLSCVHFVLQAWHFRDTLRSKASFCVTVAGHRTLFHPRGRRVSFWTLLKRWQAWAKMRGGFGGHFSWQARYWWTWTTFCKGRQSWFVKLSPFVILDMMMILCGRCSAMILQDLLTRICEHPRRTFIQPKNFHTLMQTTFKILMRGPLREDLSHKDLYKSCTDTQKISPGPLQDLLTVSQGPVQDHARTSQDFARISTRSSHKELGS